MGKNKFDLMHLFPFLSLLKNKAINEKVLKRAEFRLEASLAILHFAKILASVVNENLNGIARKNTFFCKLLRQIEGTIKCFHMTSRRPYWCPKTMKRQPCWCPKTILWELNSFLMQTLSFVPINLHRC